MKVYTVSYRVGHGVREEYFLDPEDAASCAEQVSGTVEEEDFENCPVCRGSGELGGFNAGLLCTLCNGG